MSAKVTNLLLSVGDLVHLAEGLECGLPCCFAGAGVVEHKQFCPDQETLIYSVNFSGGVVLCTRRMLVKV